MEEITTKVSLSIDGDRYSSDHSVRISLHKSMTEDERRLAKLGYKQEVKRIFNFFTNFGLTASMISVLLGVIPLYTFSLSSGGPAVQLWSWVIVFFFTNILVSSLAEICCAYPTMGALYYWAFKLGGKHGPFYSYIAGWMNLLGQVAGVSSGGYAGAQIWAEILFLSNGKKVTNAEIMGFFLVMLVIAGVVNTFSERLLTTVCYVSCVWQVVGILIIVVWMLAVSPSFQSPSFVFTSFNNDTGFYNTNSGLYVCLVGSLAAASVFTGYDTAAHVAEECVNSHDATPKAMLFAIYNAFVLGLILIIGMNFCIQGTLSCSNDDKCILKGLFDDDGSQANQAYTLIWQQTVGTNATIFFLVLTLVAIECSNCANLTSAARMIYAFARDGALPFSKTFYNIDKYFGGPVRAIWLAIFIAFCFGVPGLFNSSVLSALFSLTATGLYASYIIPIALRVTIAKDTFQQGEWNLGERSILYGWISTFWGIFMIIVLCLPSDYPITYGNLNYSPVALGLILAYALIMWHLDAKHWFKGADTPNLLRDSVDLLKNDDVNKLSIYEKSGYTLE